MAGKISRHKLAEATAAAIKDGDDKAIKRLAAYLVDEGRESEAELIVRDIELALVGHGIVIADVTSARKLADDAKEDITAFIKKDSGATDVILREQIDPDVIGGVRLAYGDKLLDATVLNKLERLA